jgi:2-dehydropantoate 2-reductase
LRILIVGAGAVGGYFGGLWTEAGLDITFLVREGRRNAIASSGLTLVREGRELRTQPRVLVSSDIQAAFDIVFLTVPGQALAEAIADIRPAIGPGSAIISSLNGVRHFEALRAAYGDEVVLGSVVKCVTTLDDKGRIVELAPVAEISIGSWADGSSERFEAIRSCLAAGGITARVSAAIHEEIAEKWLMMVALGAANSLLGGTVGDINAEPYGAWAIQTLLDEAHRALVEFGMPPRPAALDALARTLGDTASRQTSSLYRNMLAGRAIEHEPIIGDMLSHVGDHSNYPLLSAAYARLSVYESTRRRGAAGQPNQ